jgi:hypothetical protein
MQIALIFIKRRRIRLVLRCIKCEAAGSRQAETSRQIRRAAMLPALQSDPLSSIEPRRASRSRMMRPAGTLSAATKPWTSA